MLDFLVQKAYADTTTSGSSSSTAFNTLLGKILNNIANPIVYLLMAGAVIYFLWGMFVFIQNAENADKRTEGYQHMLWGIIGIFIMISAKGIINIILSTIGLG
jgi:hypothetical protein